MLVLSTGPLFGAFFETISANDNSVNTTSLNVPVGSVITQVKVWIGKSYSTGLPPTETQQRIFIVIGGTTPTGLGAAPVGTTPYPAGGTYVDAAVTRDLASTLAQGAVFNGPGPLTTPGADADFSGLMDVTFSGWVGVNANGLVQIKHVTQLGAAYNGPTVSESVPVYRVDVSYDVAGGGGAAPTASFTRTPASGIAPLMVNVTDTSTGGPTSWLTNWGDGTSTTAQNPSHTYSTAGTFTITHTAINGNGSTSATATVTVTTGAGGAGTLRVAANNKCRRAGTSIQAALLTNVPYATAAATHFNAVTPENETKIDAFWGTGPTRSSGNWAAADQIMAFAAANNMEVRGHTLVWGQSWYTNLFPPTSWLNAPTGAAFTAMVNQQIVDTFAHFGGTIKRWDVLNEAFSYYNTGLLDANIYTTHMGTNYPEQVFQMARAAADAHGGADVELWWNETNMELHQSVNLPAWVARVTSMVNAGIPIDGVGFQAHLIFGETPPMPNLVAAVNQFRALGLKVAVTEFDFPIGVTHYGTPGVRTLADQASVASAFAHAVFDAGGEEFTVWGAGDLHSWTDTNYAPSMPWDNLRYGEGIYAKPLLLDLAFAVKPAYTSVLNVVNGLPACSASPPVVSFTMSATSGVVPFTVTLTDTSSNSPTSFATDWGDGTPVSTGPNPSHTYATAGTFTITHTATNSFGTGAAATTTITAGVAASAPLASFIATPATGGVPHTVTVSNTTTGSPTITYLWNFGDGTTSTLQAPPPHVYNTPGVRTITLTATNGVGPSVATRTVTTVTAASLPPIAAFTPSLVTGVAPALVTFTDDTYQAPADTYLWNFGDGTTSTLPNPSHSYQNPGVYQVLLTVTNSAGSSTATTIITVTASEVAMTPGSSSLCDTAACLGIPTGNPTRTPTAPVFCDDGELVVGVQACRPPRLVSTFVVNNLGNLLPNDPTTEANPNAPLFWPPQPAQTLVLTRNNSGLHGDSYTEILEFEARLVIPAGAGLNYYLQVSNDGGLTWGNRKRGDINGPIDRTETFVFPGDDVIAAGTSMQKHYRLLFFRDATAGTGQPLVFEVNGLAALVHGTSMIDCA